eukprot:m.62745 g.62745  ORF g.62745 m.62745 type:complete len:263 (-) comp11531_c0_seq5:157-945(-)
MNAGTEESISNSNGGMQDIRLNGCKTTNGLLWALRPPPIGNSEKVLETYGSYVMVCFLEIPKHPHADQAVLDGDGTESFFETPMHKALEYTDKHKYGRINFQHIMRHCSRIHVSDIMGNNILHGATMIRDNFEEAMKIIICAGVSPFRTNLAGVTPLRLAETNRAPSAQFLKKLCLGAFTKREAAIVGAGSNFRPTWTRSKHWICPDAGKFVVETILLCSIRISKTHDVESQNNNMVTLRNLPSEIWDLILQHLALIDIGVQ